MKTDQPLSQRLADLARQMDARPGHNEYIVAHAKLRMELFYAYLRGKLIVADEPEDLAALSEPVAYLYVRPDGWTTVERKPQPDWVARGWTETPLYCSGQLVPVPSVEVVAQIIHEGLNEGLYLEPEDMATAILAAMKGKSRGDG